MIDDVVVGFEDTVRQPVLAHEVPEVFDWVQLWRFRRQWQDGDVGGYDQIARHMPSGLIHDDDGVGIFGNVAGDFGQMLRHGMCVAPRHDECGGLAELGTDRTEDVG